MAFRSIVLAGLVLAMLGVPAFAQKGGLPIEGQTYRISSWPDGLWTIPCSAFRKNSDGSWTQVGTIMVGTTAHAGSTFMNTDEAHILDKHCGGAH